MSGLPPVELLSWGGIAFVGGWSLWHAKVAPRLARRRGTPAA